MLKFRFTLLLVGWLASWTAGCATPWTRKDVVIYGATSAGVIAAVQAARMDRSVVLIEPSRHVGGLTTSGLGSTDFGNKQVIGGLSREFYQRIKQHYDQPRAWRYERPEDYKRYRSQDDTMWTFEPGVAEQVFQDMLREQGIKVVYGQRLKPRRGVVKRGQRIDAIRMESGRTFAGRMFIDATYEGDLLAQAGVSYFVGREPNALYGETLNGVQHQHAVHHQFVKPVDPYIVPGKPSSGLLPGVNNRPGADGQGDRRVQAYNYRICMTDVPENRVPFSKPADYDEREYELLFRNFEADDMRLPLGISMMPNRKTDVNNNFAVSTDYIGMNYDYPESHNPRRERIRHAHETYMKGLLWTLQNHPRVPAPIREKMAKWGLAKDEFEDNGHWPRTLYIREARRMVSDYVITEHDCMWRRRAKDGVGLGSYNMDSHNTQRFVTAEGYVRNEGDVQISPKGPYPIPYRSIVSRRGECDNLLVPVCISASHIAFGSVRMEPVFMVLGQSAATAASLAIDQGAPVQEVDIARLRERLRKDGQVLTWDGWDR